MEDLAQFLDRAGLSHLTEYMLLEGVNINDLMAANDAELSQLTTKLADKIRLRSAIDKIKQQKSVTASTDPPSDSQESVALPVRQSILILGPNGTLEGTPLEDYPTRGPKQLYTPEPMCQATSELTTELTEQFILGPNGTLEGTPLEDYPTRGPKQLDTPEPMCQATSELTTELTAQANLANLPGSSKSKDFSFSLGIGEEFDFFKDIDTSSTVEKSQLHSILSKHTRGKLLIEKAKNGVNLTSRDRCYIVSLIVETELLSLQNLHQSIRKDIWQKWADEITTLFIGESRDLYYVPYHIIEGKVIQASGLIHNRLITHRKTLTLEKSSKKHRVDSDSSDSGCSSKSSGTSTATYKRVRPLPDEFTDTPGYMNCEETDLDWLRGASYPRETLISKWKATFDMRMKLLKEISFVEYFKSFPGLLLPNGHELLTYDFETVYNTANSTFEEKFPLIKLRLLKLLTEKAESSRSDEAVLELLDLASAGEEEANLAAVLSIVALLRQMHTVTVPKKKLWRLTREEARNGFIARVASASEIETFCVQKDAFNVSKGIPNQPYIVAVGPSWKHVSMYEIVTTAGPRYQVPKVTQAIKLTYNLYWALDCASNLT